MGLKGPKSSSRPGMSWVADRVESALSSSAVDLPTKNISETAIGHNTLKITLK